jgi:hypothetical protein
MATLHIDDRIRDFLKIESVKRHTSILDLIETACIDTYKIPVKRHLAKQDHETIANLVGGKR